MLRLHPIVVQQDRDVVVVALTPRIFFRIVLVEGVTLGRWYLDDEPAGEVVMAQEV